MKYQIVSFGCKVNTYDAGLLQQRLNQSGFTGGEEPQVFVLNTCAVTAEATREAAKSIRRIKKLNPRSTVVVTGCGAQVDTEVYENLKEADLVIANSHKGKLEEILKDFFAGNSARVHKSNIFKKEDLEAGGGLEEDHTRSFLKIQDGCNSFCSYCVIPFARGRSRSIEVDELVKRVNDLHAQGILEVVLTGIHIGDYQDEKGFVLEDLVENVLQRTRIPRIRLSSLEPVELSERLLNLYRDDRLCKHFHMSIQSATTSVLKGMKRKYGAAEVEKGLTEISRKVPGAFVGMDVIVGFSGETENDFAETYSRLESLPWTKIHVFPYSERPGTLALKLENKNHSSTIQDRSKRLRDLSYQRYSMEALKQVATHKKVLALKAGDRTSALSRDYWRVQVAEPLSPGEHDVIVTGYDHSNYSQMEGYLLAETRRNP